MSRAKQARVFVPLMKVDEEQRLVFGKITAQEVDQSGEMMDYDTSKPNFESWSADIEKGSGGLSKGNLRVMHGLSVAGKLTDLTFNDDEKAIEVCAKVVDDAEWEKVKEGCYTGFSVGGKYGKKWKETVDGETITKFTAVPNEVSLVDNPCVKSATFQLVKAEGAVEEVMFKAAQEETGETSETETTEETATQETVEKSHEIPGVAEPSATAIAEKAGELAKAANDGSTWQDHIEVARAELTKTSALGLAVEQAREAKEDEGATTGEAETPAKETQPERGAEDSETDENADDTGTVEKTTPSGVKQLWAASDGNTFEKKADCVAYEEELQKAAAPKTEADKLAERLNKALSDEEPPVETGVIEDFGRLAKALDALSTPFDDKGEPALQKGMYTINRFSNVLSDMAALSKSIKAEGQREGNDDNDSTVAQDVIDAVKSLGKSFISYATDQVTELLAGMDDEVVVAYYDYYYNAAQVDPENGLAKDVTSLISQFRDPSRERRDDLAKVFGIEESETSVEEDGELSPPMQKRFDDLQATNDKLTKVAEQAVAAVEEMSARLKKIEDTPLPRAPRNVVLKPGDNSFLGKTADSAQERLAIIHDEIKARGPDAVATDLIKLAQSNPIPLVTR